MAIVCLRGPHAQVLVVFIGNKCNTDNPPVCSLLLIPSFEGVVILIPMFLLGTLSKIDILSLEIEQRYTGRDPLKATCTVSPREVDCEAGSLPSTTQLGIFYALQILGGQIGFPLVLFIIAIRRTTFPGIRHPVSLNFYVTWIISSLSFCLLSV